MITRGTAVYEVRAIWDPDALVWVATSDDVPGLVTEAATCEELIKKLKVLIPELLEANGLIPRDTPPEIPFHLLTERSDTASLQLDDGLRKEAPENLEWRWVPQGS